MKVEQFRKSKGGAIYTALYFKHGSILVSLGDFKTDDIEKAKAKALQVLQATINEINN